MKTGGEVLDSFEGVRGEQADRLKSYAKTRAGYFGKGSGGGGKVMDTTGRPVLQMGDLRADLGQRDGAPNALQPIVDNFIAYKGRLPSVKIMPDEETAEGEERALMRTRWLRAQFEQSNMDIQQIDAGFYLSALGDACYVLDPLTPKYANDFDVPGVYATIYSPEVGFPVFHTGRRRQELKELYLCWQQSADDAKALYPSYSGSGERQVDIITYLTEKEKYVVVDEEVVLYLKHELDFVPAQWVRNKQVGGEFAQADIAQAVDVHAEMQALFLVLGDATFESVYAPVWVRDALNIAGDALTIGPRQIIPLGERGEVGRLAPAPPPAAASGLLGTLQQALFQTTGVAPVQIENQHSGSNLSGRYMHSEQQPMETRLQLNQTIVGYHLEKLCQKMLLMVGKVTDLANHTFHVAGSDKGKAYSFDIEGGALAGPSRVMVKWDSLIGSTRHERLVMALQAYAQNLVPPTYVIEQLGEDDPEYMLKRAQIERQLYLSPPQGQPGGGDPGQQQAAIGQPGMEAAAAAQGGAPPGAAPPVGGSPPSGEGAAQPPPPSPLSMPGFAPMDASPVAPGMGPAPQNPDPMALEQQAISSLPPEVQADIAGPPAFENGKLTVYVNNGRHVASGRIKHAFAAVGLDVRVKVAR